MCCISHNTRSDTIVYNTVLRRQKAIIGLYNLNSGVNPGKNNSFYLARILMGVLYHRRHVVYRIVLTLDRNHSLHNLLCFFLYMLPMS
jgi:hypothetical protein